MLKGCKLVFSGLVPTHYKLENSKAFQVARSLGAEVQVDIDDDTTHVVAVRPGTAKVSILIYVYCLLNSEHIFFTAAL